MRDSDSSYPRHQSQRGPSFDDEQGQGPLHQRAAPTQPQLPPQRVRNTLIIAVIAGLLGAIQAIAITIANASLYREGADKASNMPLNVAEAIFGLFCLTSTISLLIYLVAGFVIGKVAVERRMGFFGGFVAGLLAQGLGFLTQYIPGYPGVVNSGFSGGLAGFSGGLITALVLALLIGLVAGLVSFLGARLATRRHPYYVGYEV
jgi:hypothetical protein